MDRIRRIVGAAGAIALIAGCGSSPQSIDGEETEVPGFTVTHEGLQLTLERANFGWVPAEGPVPPPDPVHVTVRVRIVNVGDGPRTLALSDFRLRTWDGSYPYDPPRNTPAWFAVPAGREPSLTATRLTVGEAVEGWLTYEVPRGDDRADAFVWRPRSGRAFRMVFPAGSGSLVCGVSRIFGSVLTREGDPVSNAEIDLIHWDLGRPGNTFESGRCRGEATGAIAAVTDANGRFEERPFWRFCDERCFEAVVKAPQGSGLSDARTGGGVVFPAPAHPMIEPSELRLDAVLPAE